MPKPKLSVANILGIVVISIGLLGTGSGLTIGAVFLRSDVNGNTEDITEIKDDFKSLDGSIGKLEVAIGKLTTAIELRHEEPD